MDPNLSIDEIKKNIPQNCFKSNLFKSLMYMFVDIAILSTALFTYEYIKNLGIIWHLLYWNVYGFFAWCLFVVGHDCGHGSFSDYSIINSVCGHICHSMLMVPFYPWARSHYYHHRYHNSKNKDKSHPWITDEELKEYPYLTRNILPSVIGPFIGFWIYLTYGLSQDGSHFVWFGKLYENTSKIEKIKSVISCISVFSWIYIVYSYTNNLYDWWMMYGGVISICYFWLYMITWLQHHSEDTLVYSDESWGYLKGAVQTIDHKIGYKIDELHHNITDCHLVHHIFFREIPHYNLKEATNALYKYLDKEKKSYLIKYVDHSQFPLKYIYDFFKTYLKIGITKWTYVDK